MTPPHLPPNRRWTPDPWAVMREDEELPALASIRRGSPSFDRDLQRRVLLPLDK